ncbi:TPA: thiamine phosphate synthase, partial [Candidatus Sumerlaeota bacterium]|nr:thiamine phosphate synthase [Candidatus Sumerlaeota bacterium]
HPSALIPPLLLLITDRTAYPAPFEETIASALRGGVNAVMLREKDLSARELYALAVRLRMLTRDAGAQLIINDRLDVALAVEADGVHLGWRSLPLKAARAVTGNRLQIGVSTHSAEEAQQAERDGADYITFSPIFPTPSKEGLVPVQGLDGLRAATNGLLIRCIALGGITPENTQSVCAAGAAGVAAIRPFATDPEETANRFHQAL